jgi:methyl coenzyme M reductase gamma subunit
MTTKHSPLSALKKQADQIAGLLKAAERGDKIDVRFADKITAARAKPSFKAGIAMDDKFLTIELPWTLIRDTEEAALSEYIVNQMRERSADQ